jgi:hypothetical protein
MTWIIPSDREGHWNPAGLSLKSPRFLSNRWGPPHRARKEDQDWRADTKRYRNTCHKLILRDAAHRPLKPTRRKARPAIQW